MSYEEELEQAIAESLETFRNEKGSRKDFTEKLEEEQEEIFKRVWEYYNRKPVGNNGLNMCSFWIVAKLCHIYRKSVWSYYSIINTIEKIKLTKPSEFRPIGEEQTEDFLSEMLKLHEFSIKKRVIFNGNIPYYLKDYAGFRILGCNYATETQWEVIHDISYYDYQTHGHFHLKKI